MQQVPGVSHRVGDDNVRAFAIVGFSTLFILPCCLLRDVSKLETISFASTVTVIIVIALVIVEAFMDHPWPKTAPAPNYEAELDVVKPGHQ
jgi:hypothetical protein